MLLASKTATVDVTPGTTSSVFFSKNQKWALLTLVTIGVALRLFHFFDNRSFWIDELYLNVSLVKMGFQELATLPMAYEQKAPLGYLWAEKLAVVLFGKGEMALRLFPLICGIGSLLVFIPVARHFLKPWGVLVALGVLTLGGPAIYHAVEAKQYSTELFASILSLYFYIRFRKSHRILALVLWGLGGGLLVWFSYSTIFMLAGIAIAVSTGLLLKQDWKNFFLRIIPFAMWLVSFGLVYYFYMMKFQDSGWLKYFFEVMYNAFMPLPPTSLHDLTWFVRTPYVLLQHPLGLLLNFGGHVKDYSAVQSVFRMPFLPLLLGALGAFSLFRRNKFDFALLVLPIALALLASGLKLYPFNERFTLFLLPLFILLLAFGAERAVAFFSSKNKAVAPLLLLLILAPPAWNATREVVDPGNFYKKEYNREAVLYVNDRYKPGDVVYVYWNMYHAYTYYKEAYNLKYEAVGGKDLRHSSKSTEEYLNNVLQEMGDLGSKKRLWLIYNPGLKNNIGDFVGLEPKWYHEQGFEAGKTLESSITALGATPADSLQLESVAVKLFDLPTR